MEEKCNTSHTRRRNPEMSHDGEPKAPHKWCQGTDDKKGHVQGDQMVTAHHVVEKTQKRNTLELTITFVKPPRGDTASPPGRSQPGC